MSYLQAIVIALVQDVTELFPVSSLGHSLIVPAWFGGSWQTLVTQSAEANSESSFYLAFIVALHVSTALALLWFFRADWIRISGGFTRSARRSLRDRRFSAQGSDERLAWLIVIATIPVGLTGLLLEHTFRTIFAKPLAASIFLVINGLILLAGDRARRRAETAATAAGLAPRARMPIAGASPELDAPAAVLTPSFRGPRSAEDLAEAYASDSRISRLPYRDGVSVGLLQVLALLPGISRSGVTMVGGLTGGPGGRQNRSVIRAIHSSRHRWRPRDRYRGEAIAPRFVSGRSSVADADHRRPAVGRHPWRRPRGGHSKFLASGSYTSAASIDASELKAVVAAFDPRAS